MPNFWEHKSANNLQGKFFSVNYKMGIIFLPFHEGNLRVFLLA